MTKEFDNAGSAPKDGAASDANVTCTAVHQIAEWLQECESCLETLDKHDVWHTVQARPIMNANAIRLRSILNAINARK